MKQLFFLLIFFLTTSVFGFSDSDLDGVDDTIDKCPNTPFMDIVDLGGCTKKSLISPHHYDIIVGLSYSGADYANIDRSDTFSTSLQADYYYKEFSMQVSTSYYTTKGDTYTQSGLYDTFVGTSYRFTPIKEFSFYVGAGVLLPTYETDLNNNNTDYKASASLNYYIRDLNLFAGYSYTFVGDEDVSIVDTNGNVLATYLYQNTSSFNGGVGYYMSTKLYMSVSYYIADSIYTNVERIKSTSLYGYYSINSNWFATFSYSRGLSESATDNYISLRFGYYF